MTDKRPISTYDFLNYSYISDPQIAPDGSQILFVVKQVGLQNCTDSTIWISSLASSSPRPFTRGFNDSQPRWAPDGRSIAFLRSDSRGYSQVYVINCEGGEAMPMAFFPEGVMGDLRWSPDGRWLAVKFREVDEEWTSSAKARRRDLGLSDPPRVIDSLWYRYEGEGYFDRNKYTLYLIDAHSGRAFEIFNSDVLGAFHFDFSPDSKRLAITANRSETALTEPWKDEVLLLDIASKQVRSLQGVPSCKKFRILWSPDGSKLAFGGFLGQERAYCPNNVGIFVADVQSGKTTLVTAKHDLCFQGHLIADGAKSGILETNFLWLADSQHLIASVTHHGQRHLVTIDLVSEAITFETCGRYLYELGNVSADGSTLALTRGSGAALPEVFVGKVSGKEIVVQQITHLNDDCFSNLIVVEPEEHWIAAADGSKIQLWMVRPPEATKEAVTPAILDIHGGPHGCYGDGFRHDVQVLAAQGYTVIYPNIRGSKGYGSAFSMAIRDRWASKDWDDIQSVMAFIQRQPNIDAERMGILGVSYGGYMANWTISHTHLFKAAVSDRAICNLVSFFGTTDIVRPPELFGHASPWEHAEVLWDASPLKYAGQVTTPTLVIHSEGDLRVNVEQAEQWYTALRFRNIPSRFVRYPRTTGHFMAAGGPPDLRLHRLEQIVMWFQTYLEDNQ